MTQHEHSVGLITIGVDPHKYSWTAVAVDSQGTTVAMPTRVDATDDGFGRLVRWSRPWPLHQWAVENARGMGRDLAQRLLQRHERVVHVPAKLSTRVRLLASGHPRSITAAPWICCAKVRLGQEVRHVLIGDRRTEAPAQRKLIAVWTTPQTSRGLRPVIVALGCDGAELSRMGPRDGLDTRTWARLRDEL